MREEVEMVFSFMILFEICGELVEGVRVMFCGFEVGEVESIVLKECVEVAVVVYGEY